MKTDEGCLSDLELDLLLNLLLNEEFAEPSDERRRGHVAACARCGARLIQLERGRARFESMGLPLAELITERAKPRRSRWLGAPGALAAMALGVVALGVAVAGDALWPSSEAVSPANAGGARDEPRGVRGKGSQGLDLFVRHAGGLREAGDREVVYAGDQLQFAYTSATVGYVAVLSRDGAGRVSVYVPSDAAEAWRAPAGERQLLPESTILDDILGREQVYALFCAKELALEPLASELRQRGMLDAPEGCSMRRIELEKRERP